LAILNFYRDFSGENQKRQFFCDPYPGLDYINSICSKFLHAFGADAEWLRFSLVLGCA
jgi:hypothetical protein